MCIPFQTIPPPTQGTKKAVQMLQILGVCQFIVGLLKIFLLSGLAGFYDFFTLLILYMAWAQLGYCNCVIAVFYFMQNILMIFIFFGMNVELDLKFFSPTKQGVLYFILFFYYSIACYIGFLAYREFKTLQYDMQRGMIGAYQNDQETQRNDYTNNQQQNNQQDYAFQQQETQNRRQGQQQQQGSSGFVAFQGRGVQIG